MGAMGVTAFAPLLNPSSHLCSQPLLLTCTIPLSTMNHVNSRDEVIEAFKVFDKEDKGYLRVDELRLVLTELGDYMDDNEIEELLYEADSGNGQVNYDHIVQKLFQWDA